MKLKDLIPNTNVDLRVSVLSKGNERTVKNGLGVCEFKVGDDTKIV